MAGAGIKTDSFSVEHVKCCEIPVTELITVRVSDTEETLIMSRIYTQSGVTFRAELCIPWDASEAVVDIDSADLVSLGSFPDKVGL